MLCCFLLFVVFFRGVGVSAAHESKLMIFAICCTIHIARYHSLLDKIRTNRLVSFNYFLIRYFILSHVVWTFPAIIDSANSMDAAQLRAVYCKRMRAYVLPCSVSLLFSHISTGLAHWQCLTAVTVLL